MSNNTEHNNVSNNELLYLIKRAWFLQPEWSYGKFITEITYIAIGHTFISEATDEQLKEACEKFIAANGNYKI